MLPRFWYCTRIQYWGSTTNLLGHCTVTLSTCIDYCDISVLYTVSAIFIMVSDLINAGQRCSQSTTLLWFFYTSQFMNLVTMLYRHTLISDLINAVHKSSHYCDSFIHHRIWIQSHLAFILYKCIVKVLFIQWWATRSISGQGC